MAIRGSSRANPLRESTQGFWHRPDQMHLAADFLLFGAIVALLYAATAAALTMPVFPLPQLEVVTPLKQVTRTQVEIAANSSLTGNFFTVDLDKVQLAFKKLPWVRRVTVHRVWPDRIELELEEHVAEALWKQEGSDDTRLVNNLGEVFTAASHKPMPELTGPGESRAPEILNRYRELAPMVQPLGRSMDALRLTSREAWQARLDDGLVLELGREQLNAPLKFRLARFVENYNETVQKVQLPFSMADLRYPNGFALRVGKAVTPAAHGVKEKE